MCYSGMFLRGLDELDKTMAIFPSFGRPSQELGRTAKLKGLEGDVSVVTAGTWGV